MQSIRTKTDTQRPSTNALSFGRLGMILVYIAIGLYILLSIYPFLWMVSAALKTSDEVYRSKSLMPENVSFNTLIETWNNLDFLRHFGNSLFLTLLVVGGVLLFAVLVTAFQQRRRRA